MAPNAKTTELFEKSVLLPDSHSYGSIDPYKGERDAEKGEINHESSPAPAGKSIGFLGAFAIGVNSLCGPALLQLPYQYQQSGVIPTTACLIVVGALAYFVTMHMSNVVSQVPGNSNFEKSVEFSDPFATFWSPKAFFACQLVYYLCTVSLNVAAIVDTAQVVDSFLGHTVGSRALAADNIFEEPFQEWKRGPCSRKMAKEGVCEPFGGVDQDGEQFSDWLITSGYVVALLFFLPICLMDLKDNTKWQIFAFLVTVTVSTQFVISFLQHGLDVDNVSWWGEDYSGLLGAILFNYGLVLAMPALLSAKKSSVDTKTMVQGSVVMTTILYVLVGLLGAMAIPNVNINMLKPMVSGAYGPTLQWAGWFFAFFIIGLDIPLFSVLTRYNMVSEGLCSDLGANTLVVYLPWAVSWAFYQGDAIEELLSWGGVLFTSAAAFILPLYLALRVLVFYPEAQGSIDVYCGYLESKEAKTKSLYALLFLAGVAVCLGIFGQAQADLSSNELEHDEEYLEDSFNSTRF